MAVMEYVAKFTKLAYFVDDYVAKVRRFEVGLKLSIQGNIMGHRLQDLDTMVETVMVIERNNPRRMEHPGSGC